MKDNGTRMTRIERISTDLQKGLELLHADVAV